MTIFNAISGKYQLKFKDRITAGNILGEALKDVIRNAEERRNSIVLGIPRGGVIIADIIARKLACDFAIIISRKLCAPHNSEVAVGAIVDSESTYLNEFIVNKLEVSPEYIEREKKRQLEEVTNKYAMYCTGNRLFVDFKKVPFGNKTVILTDDGAATGATIIAATKWIKTIKSPARFVTAIPVVPKNTLKLLKEQGFDHVEVITSPTTLTFNSVQQYYHNFEQISDEQVIGIIEGYRK
jgi:putative phosphoribosyl transferase